MLNRVQIDSILCVILLIPGTQSETTTPPRIDARDGPIAEILRLPEAIDADRVLEEQSRHILCIPLLRIFNLELQRPLKPGEHIGLTGSHSRLGEWQPDRSIEMRSLDGGQRLEWLAKVFICANDRIYYRYFIYTLDQQGHKRIHVWEGQQHARVLESYEIYRQPGIDYFGETSDMALDLGGYGCNWLRQDYLIQLKFIWQWQLKFQKQAAPKRHNKVRLKLVVIGRDLHAKNISDTLVDVSRYAYNRSHFRQQPPNGVIYNYNGNGDIVIFRIFEALHTRNSYELRINNLDGQRFGSATILAVDLKESEGILQVPVHSAVSGFEIGRLILPYVKVQPLPHAELLDLRGSYQHFWPLNWPTMHVGNRGTGKSFYNSDAPFVENTIRSFLRIYKIKGDMIELDVQLTKDYVPVIWHEYGFYTAARGRRVQSIVDLDYVFIQQLSYRELKRQRVFALKSPGNSIKEYTHLNVHNPRILERIFPRLAEVFQRLPKSLGIIVDIKWPQSMQSGGIQLISESGTMPTLDKNRYVDRLIAVTSRSGCGRPLIFASFDADTCMMLRYKQNVYPVMFLTTGKTNLWQPYKDLRTRTFTNAVHFAQSEMLLGTAPHVSNFLDRPQQLNLGLDLLQAVFLWGEELQNEQWMKKFQSLRATGLIYDRMDLHCPAEQRIAFFTAKELMEIFSRQCLSTLRNASIQIGTRTRSKVKRKFFTIRIPH